MCPLSTINNIEIHPIEKKLFKPAPLDVILTTTSGWSLHEKCLAQKIKKKASVDFRRGGQLFCQPEKVKNYNFSI